MLGVAVNESSGEEAREAMLSSKESPYFTPGEKKKNYVLLYH